MIMVGVPVQPDARRADACLLLMHIADDKDLVMVGQAVVAERVQIRPAAESAGESQIGAWLELLLAAEQQQGPLDAGRANDGHHLGVVLIAKVHAVDRRADMLGKIDDFQPARGGGLAPIHLLRHQRLPDGKNSKDRGTVIAPSSVEPRTASSKHCAGMPGARPRKARPSCMLAGSPSPCCSAWAPCRRLPRPANRSSPNQISWRHPSCRCRSTPPCRRSNSSTRRENCRG